VSAISLVEILYLEEKHRLPAGVLARLADELAATGGTLAEVPVCTPVIQSMSLVSRAEIPDMPDRIIAGTAVHLRVPLISRDAKIRASAVATIW